MPTQLQFNTSLQTIRDIDCKLFVLDYDYAVIDEISGKTESVSLSVNAESDIRRTANISMVLKEQPLVNKVNFTEDEILVSFGGDEKEAAQLLKTLFERNILVSNFYREKEDLESLFLEITGGAAS